MVTAKDESDDIVEALDLGANDYVTKPIDFAVALARIRAQVTARRADPLTGLPNRVLFMDRLEPDADGRHQETGHPAFAVLFLDLDRFKVINDSLGHAAGDELLVEIARRLEGSLRATDTVARFEGEHTLARMGGDEFTVLLDGVGDDERALAIAERLRAAVAQPFVLQGGKSSRRSASASSSAPRGIERAEDMVRDADTAMYRAKELGKARCEIFDTSMLRGGARSGWCWNRICASALERQRAEVYYQPIVSLPRRRLTGFEALLRWRHPRRGLVLPGRVHSDRGGDRPDRADRHAGCSTRPAASSARGSRSFRAPAIWSINVNLSARQCMHPDLLRDVRRILDETGVRAVAGQARDHRRRRAGELRCRREGPARAARARRAAGPRRLRHGLLRVELPPSVSVPDDQDRSRLRQRHGGWRQHRDHPRDRRRWPRAWHGRDGRRHRDVDQVDRLQELACEFGQGYYFNKPLTTRGRARHSRGTDRG